MGEMRKLFRMRHEPCNGTCYAPDDVMKIASLSKTDREEMIARFEALHRRTCGDSRFGFGLDLDEAVYAGYEFTEARFVGHVHSPEGTSLVGGVDLLSTVRALLDLAERTMSRHEPRPDLSACDHGASGDFRAFWLNHGGAT